MRGKRVYCGNGNETPLLEPGAYGKHPRNDKWYACTPNGHLGSLSAHKVEEHEDGTITVSPSILVSKPAFKGHKEETLWHGYLIRGEWREC